jgi:hypothetical protein
MKTLNLIAKALIVNMLVLPAVASSQPLKSFEGSDDSIKVIELRNYTIQPGKLSKFVEFMNRIIIPRQESQRGYVLNQFGLKGSDNNYVWMRGFYDMQTRSQFLKDFYSSEYWKQHQQETNRMLTNIEYIYLLRPLLIKDQTVDVEASVSRGELKKTKGIAVINFYTTNQKRGQLIDFLAKEYFPILRKAGISNIQLWISEMARNDFWLPAIQDPNLLVAITRYQDEEDFKTKQRKVDGQLKRTIKARLKELVTSAESQIVYPLSVER